MKPLKKMAMLLLSIVALHANAQTDKVEITKAIESKKYTLIPTIRVERPYYPVTNYKPNETGDARFTTSLTPGIFFLTVTPDSISVYLPDFRSNVPRTMRGENGRYTSVSKKFSYSETKNKRGIYTIVTELEEHRVKMILSVGEKGYATLVMSSAGNETITYNGYIVPNNDNSIVSK